MTFKDYRDIMHQMERDMQQLSDEVFRGFFDLPVSSGRFWYPPVDIYETEDDLLVKIEIAGVRAEDLQVALSSDNRVLTVAGMRRDHGTRSSGRVSCHQLEIYFGPFERAIPLPHSVLIDRERLSAVYKEGFLVVTLPKLTVQQTPQTRMIKINEGAAQAENEEQKTEA